MIDPAAFARLLAGYCLEVQPGQQVVLRSTTLAAPLLLELRGAMSPATRREYAELAPRTREDLW